MCHNYPCLLPLIFHVLFIDLDLSRFEMSVQIFFYLAYLDDFWFKFVVGADSEGPWFMPDILVNVRRAGEESIAGIIREVLPVCTYKSFEDCLFFACT